MKENPKPSKAGLGRPKLLIAIGAGAIIGIIIAAGGAFAKLAIHGKYPSGTYVANIDISHKTPEESKELLNAAKENYFNTALEITFAGETKKITPAELGVKILVAETIESIKTVDARKINLFDLIFAENSGKTNVELITISNNEKLLSEIDKNFQTKDLAPKPATFFFDETNKLAIKEGQRGEVPEYEPLIRELKASAKQLEAKNITLTTVEKDPLVTAEMLENQKERIKESLEHRFALIDPVYSDDWYLKLAEHLDWVQFVQKQKVKLPYLSDSAIIENPIEGLGGETFVAIEINQDKLNEYIDEKISKWLDRPPEPVNISRDGAGKITIEGKGSDGRKVQRSLLKESIELAVANKIVDVPIPVIELPPTLNISEELRDLGIKERLSVGHTSYYGSPPNRVHNIKLGSAQFNGLLIAPDEVFSFNENLGQVAGETGYKKELVIKKEGTVPEYGGGICQVSTTMFRSALFSGLPTVERNQHSYAVSYYSQVLGHGLDATIYLGGADLKFKNDTGQHILIQTYTENDYELFIVFYGTADGRSVELEGPYLSNYNNPGATVYIDTDELAVGQQKQVEKPHTGFNALWYRYLTDKDGNVTKEPIETRYRTVPKKIWVGTRVEKST